MHPIRYAALLSLAPLPFFLAHLGGDHAQPETKKGPTPESAVKALMEGNARYIAAKGGHPNQTLQRREEVAKGQNPFAIIVGCADSRVPPEIVFDQGLGDLFVVRVAGNVVDDTALGSIEYAAEHLHAPLIVVLSHERCGAVKATLDGGEMPGHIGTLTKKIAPAVEVAKHLPGDKLDNAVRAQAVMVAERLRESKPILNHLTESGNLMVVAARYDLDSGIVEFMSSAIAVAEVPAAAAAAPVEAKPAEKVEKKEDPHARSSGHGKGH